MANIVAIVGRPNVGKSTFFNRMIQKREAIVDSQSGVTRDRHYGESDWNGKKFTLIDTGGYLKNSDDIFQKEIDKQVTLAIEESDSIIFMVDVEDGVTGMDQTISKLLRKSKKPVLIAVNKTDNSKRLENSLEFYSMGFDLIFPISAINGSGSGELLDALVEKFNQEPNDEASHLPRFSVVGRPNAGKSSFINSLIGEERYIVTKEAGTTRDSIDTKYNRFGFEFNLVDTAGIRKKSKVKEDIEFYSVMRSIRAIENSDVCLLLFDANREFDAQVQNIFWLAQRNPIPESVINKAPEEWFFAHTSREKKKKDFFSPKALNDYLECVKNPETINSICEDYRAAASIDLIDDKISRENKIKIKIPILILWGKKGKIGQWYDPLSIWKEYCSQEVKGYGIDTGHYLAEENPEEIIKNINEFLT